MAFEGVSQKLQAVFKRLNSRGKLNEADVKEAMREIKLALLEADVNFMVVKEFVKTVTDRAVGSRCAGEPDPGQQVVKIVNEELTRLMGGEQAKLEFGSEAPAVILMAGLQGAGKTTMCGKLGAYIPKALRQERAARPPATSIARRDSAASRSSAKSSDIPVYDTARRTRAHRKRAIAEAKRRFIDVVIVDTAGRCISTGI
jgi:signal recognition particle subunit SRP54